MTNPSPNDAARFYKWRADKYLALLLRYERVLRVFIGDPNADWADLEALVEDVDEHPEDYFGLLAVVEDD